MDQIGPIAGLAAAACWASASILYVRVPIGAGAMTTFKNSLAAVCLLAALVAWTQYHGTQLFQASASAWWDIGLSGIIGLSLADIAYFRSIQILGPRRGITLTLLIPPLTTLLGQWWLGEVLGWATWGWILLTLTGIGIVMRERTEKTEEQGIRPGTTQWGVTCALLGVVTMAIGAVILKRGTVDVGAIEGTFIRLISASVFSIVVSGVNGELREIAALFSDRRGMRDLCAATLLGTVVGVWFMLIAYQRCSTGIAATLTSTSPLFIIPVVWFAYRQKISAIGIAGASIAFAGVCGLLLAG